MEVDLEQLRAFPKVSLQIILMAVCGPARWRSCRREARHQLPATDPDELGRWFAGAADSGSLVRYLEMFEHTIAVMQTATQLRRVAREFVEDLAADGVIYGEARWAPQQHLRAGLSERRRSRRYAMAWPKAWKPAPGAEQTSSSANWSQRCATSSRRATSPILRCATAITASWASTSPVRRRGYPPARFLDSFSHLRRNNAYYTIHAGEAGGLASIEEAVQVCAANRIGHGVAIMEDIKGAERGATQLGDFAAYVRNERICLEMCPSSNVQYGSRRLNSGTPDRCPSRPGLPGNGEHGQSADERDDID